MQLLEETSRDVPLLGVPAVNPPASDPVILASLYPDPDDQTYRPQRPPEERIEAWKHLFHKEEGGGGQPPEQPPGPKDGNEGPASLEQFLNLLAEAHRIAARIPASDLNRDQQADLFAIVRSIKNYSGLLRNV